MTKTISTKARVISLLLALALVVGMLPLISVPASAGANSWVFAWKDTNNNGKIDNGEQTFTDWNDALRSGGTVKLQSPSDYAAETDGKLFFTDFFRGNVAKNHYVDLKDVTVTLDLNGQFVECGNWSASSSFVLSGNTKLTITDSAGGGKLRTYDMKVPFALSDSAEVVFAGGYFDIDTLNASSLSGNAKFTVTGGTFRDNPEAYVAPNHKVRMDNGEAGALIFKVSEVTMEETEAWIDADGDGVLDSDERRFASLADALAFGGEIKLYRDIQMTKEAMPWITLYLNYGSIALHQGYLVTKTAVLDLNGHSITTDGSVNNVFFLVESVSLTLRDSKGTGAIDCRKGSNIVYLRYNSSLTVEGGTYYKDDTSYPFSSYVSSVSLTGGRYDFNPNDPEVTGGGNGYKTYGYIAVPDGDMWTIVPDGEVCTVAVPGTYVYGGKPVIPTVTVTAPGGAVLKENVDYTVTHENNNEVGGGAKATVTFIKDYRGSQTVTYTIDSLTISKSWADSVKIPATGTTTSVTLSAALSVAGTDVTTDTVWSLQGTPPGVSLNGNVLTVDSTATKGTVTVTATYAGVTKTCTVTLATEQLPSVSLSYRSIGYNGQPQKPTVTVDGCTEGVDYTVSYFRDDVETDNVTDAGTIFVRVTGLGKYNGSHREIHYQIMGVHMGSVSVTLPPDVTYNGLPQKPAITATYNNMTLVEGTDYTVVYTRDGSETADFTKAGTLFLKLVGMGSYYSSTDYDYAAGKKFTYTIGTYAVSESEVTFSQTEHTWDNKAHKPTVTITGAGGATLAEGKDYTVVYTRDGSETADFTSCGTVTMAATCTGNYKGSFSQTFAVNHSLDENHVCRGCQMNSYYVAYSWDTATAKRTSETKNAALAATVTEVTSSGPTTWTNGWYAVWGTVNLNTVTVQGDDVHLILRDGASLNAKRIVVNSGNSLAIYGQQNGTGKLTLSGEHNTGASLGGNQKTAAGSVAIHGGVLNVTAGNSGAAIGSGANGSGGEVTIYHGTVTTGGYGGIGGGYEATNARVTIHGGTVTAVIGNKNAAAIGGYDGFSVAIHGGNVTATGGGLSAGIGGEHMCRSGVVVITGGNIKATAGSSGGSGYNVKSQAVGTGSVWKWTGSGSPVTVSDGTGRTPVLETLTVNRLSESKAITALSDSGYGVWDMVTMDTNKLYLYRASNAAEITSLTVDGTTYECHKNKLFFRSHSYGGSCDEVCSQCGAARDTMSHHQYNNENGLCDKCGAGEPAIWNATGNYYEIANAGNLVWFADLVNGMLGTDTAKNAAANAVLLNDIDMTDATEFVPIGQTALYYSATGSDKGYTGTFDGCGHVIRNLSVAGSDTWETTYGVFGTLGGTVKRLGVESFTFNVNSQDCRAGGLVGQMVAGGVVDNCYVANSTVTATNKVAGGLAGCNYGGTVKNSFTYKVTVEASRKGGIVGDNRGDKNKNDRKGTVSNCYTDNTALESSYAGTVSGGAAGVSSETFASGEITYKLNGQQFNAAVVWHQTLTGENAQAYPQFTGGSVFSNQGTYGNATPVTITGLTGADNAEYNAQPHTGYTGTPANAEGYTVGYEVTYTGRGGTEYNATTPPTAAGQYTVHVSTDSASTDYYGVWTHEFVINKKSISMNVQEQSLVKGDSLEETLVTVGAVLPGHTATVTALTKNANTCTYTATVQITDGQNNEVTANYQFNNTGVYHESDWNTATHEYGCINCHTVYATDTEAPTAQYQIGTNGWKQFVNTVTFGLFCKDYQTLTVLADDATSGMAKTEYAVYNDAAEVPTDLSLVPWAEYTEPLSLNAKNTYLVYLRVTDKAGNTAVYNSEGIVIFEDSTPAGLELEYTKTTGTDVKAAIDFRGNTVQKVMYNGVLQAGTDYTLQSDGITLKASFLETLKASDTPCTVTVIYNAGGREWGSDSYGTKAADTVMAITVKPAARTVQVDSSAMNKVYDGNAVIAPTHTAVGNGTVTVEYKGKDAADSTYTATAPSAAGNYTVRVTVAADGTYEQASATADFAIANADITDVSVKQNGVLEYTGAPQAARVTVTATTQGGQETGILYSTAEAGPFTADMPTFTNANGYTVYYRLSAPSHNTVNGSFKVSIQKAPNSFVINPQISDWTYGESASPWTAQAKFGTVSVMYSGDSYDGTERLVNSEVPPTKPGSYDAHFFVAGDEAGNYAGTVEDCSFEIAKAPVTVTPNTASKTYGDSDPASYDWSITGGSLVGNDTLSGITVTRTSGEEVGNYPLTATADATANINYIVTCEPGVFKVNKAELTVTADDKTATYGDTAPTYTATVSGWKRGDTEAVLGGTLGFDCDYVQFADKGNYAITPKGYTADNYSFRYVAGNLAVAAKPITVTIGQKSSVYGEAPVALTGTTNGIVNGDTGVYRLSTAVNGKTVVGQYDITGETLDSNYTVTFEGGSQAYTVTQRTLTVSVVVNDKPYDNKNTASIASAQLNNVVNGDLVTLRNGEPTFASVQKGNDIDIVFTSPFELIGTDEVLRNYTLQQPTGVKANITNDWNPVEGVEFTVSVAPNSNGWMKEPLLIEPKAGYILANEIIEGQHQWTGILVVSKEGQGAEFQFYVRNTATGAISEQVTVTYNLDRNTKNTGTTGKVEFVERSSWQSFVNTITFGLFYKDEVTVKAEASDALSGVDSIEYAVSDQALTLEQVKEITEWTAMPQDGVGVTLEDEKQFVYFVRITDLAGNVTYLSTDGAEYDTTLPAIDGVENGAVYHSTRVVTVTDKNLESVQLNGQPVEPFAGTLTLDGNTDATYTVTATDKAGNVTEFTVTMKPLADLSESVKDLTEDTVTANNKQELEQVADALGEELENPNLTNEEQQELESAKTAVEDLLKKIDEVGGKANDLTDRITELDKDKVTSDDKQTIQDLIDELDELLNGGNLTETEKEELGQMKDTAEDLINRIDEVGNKGTDLTDRVGELDKDTVTGNDKQTVQDLIDELDELLGGDNLTETEKEELGQVKDAAEDLINRIDEAQKAADTDSIGKVSEITVDTVILEDKDNLETAKDDLENALSQYEGNLTDSEKQDIRNSIERIEQALASIERVETVKELIDNLPTVLTESTAEAVRDAQRAYNALTEHEQLLVAAAYQAKLASAGAALEEMGKPTETPNEETPENKPTDNKQPDNKQPADDTPAEGNTKTGATSALPAALAVAVALSAAALWLTGKRRRA